MAIIQANHILVVNRLYSTAVLFLQIDYKKIALVQHINEISTYVFIGLIGSLVRVCHSKYEGPKHALMVFIGGSAFGTLAAIIVLIFFSSDKWASVSAAAFSLLCNELYDMLKIRIPELLSKYLTNKLK